MVGSIPRPGQVNLWYSQADVRRSHLRYNGLAGMLIEIVVPENEVNIRTKISRGGFTAVFFVQCLEAIGCYTVRLTEPSGT